MSSIESTVPLRLFVVDDHTLFRRGLIALLSADARLEVMGEAGDMGQALRLLATLKPDVVLLDNHMPGVSGIQGIPAIKELCPSANVLILTVSEEREHLIGALKAGADGYLLKTAETHALIDGVMRVVAGESVVSPELTRVLLESFRPESSPPTNKAQPADQGEQLLEQLSLREREILGLIARGCSNKVIARELQIAETTVKVHVQHILRKLQLSSRVQAAVFATHRGLGNVSS